MRPRRVVIIVMTYLTHPSVISSSSCMFSDTPVVHELCYYLITLENFNTIKITCSQINYGGIQVKIWPLVTDFVKGKKTEFKNDIDNCWGGGGGQKTLTDYRLQVLLSVIHSCDSVSGFSTLSLANKDTSFVQICFQQAADVPFSLCCQFRTPFLKFSLPNWSEMLRTIYFQFIVGVFFIWLLFLSNTFWILQWYFHVGHAHLHRQGQPRLKGDLSNWVSPEICTTFSPSTAFSQSTTYSWTHNQIINFGSGCLFKPLFVHGNRFNTFSLNVTLKSSHTLINNLIGALTNQKTPRCVVVIGNAKSGEGEVDSQEVRVTDS